MLLRYIISTEIDTYHRNKCADSPRGRGRPSASWVDELQVVAQIMILLTEQNTKVLRCSTVPTQVYRDLNRQLQRPQDSAGYRSCARCTQARGQTRRPGTHSTRQDVQEASWDRRPGCRTRLSSVHCTTDTILSALCPVYFTLCKLQQVAQIQYGEINLIRNS